MAMIRVSLLLVFGFKVVVQSNKGVGVCLTPKLASSTLLKYLLETEAGAPINGYRYLTSVGAAASIYDVKRFPEPLHGFEHPSYGQLELPPVMFVLFRDPWVRLLSGFRSKMLGSCNGNATCFKHKYVKATNPNSKHNALVQYFNAVLNTPPQKLNFHFKLQTYQCLTEWLTTSSVLLDIENPYSKFVI
jgi:hypothetical protein